MKPTRVFIHGLLGSSKGTKATFFRQKYPDMVIDDYRGTLSERMERLNSLLSEEKGLVVVGSSFGGLMAAIYGLVNQERVTRLVLLAPALAYHEFEPYLTRTTDKPVIIYHGKNDSVVPLDPVREHAQRVFKNLTFNAVEDDHVLSRTFTSLDWEKLLQP